SHQEPDDGAVPARADNNHGGRGTFVDKDCGTIAFDDDGFVSVGLQVTECFSQGIVLDTAGLVGFVAHQLSAVYVPGRGRYLPDRDDLQFRVQCSAEISRSAQGSDGRG